MPPTKWYVNLYDRYGGTTKTRAGGSIDLIATRSFGHNRKRQGNRQVDWTLVEAGTNGGDVEYFQVGHRARLDSARTTERANGEFQNTLRVPALGGRTYTVTARKTNGVNNVAFNKQYEVWRRIYYSVHTMTPQLRTLFESVEQQIKDVFAGVHIELKRRHINACIINEAVTVRNAADPTLPDTYDGPELDRHPHHLRAVLVRDLVDDTGFDVHWTMDANTAPLAGRLIGIGSRAPNHSVVVYSNTLATIDANNPATELQVHVHSATVAVPNACVARNTDHQLTVDFTADLTTTPIGTAINGGAKANFTATLTGIRCQAGFQAGNNHPVQANISRTTLEANPVTVGSARVWTASNGAVAYIRDPNIILANPGAADQLRITLADTSAVDLLVGDITRQDDNTLRISLASDVRVSTALANGETIQLSIRRHGVLGLGPIQASANYDFDLREFRSGKNTTRRNVEIRVNADGQSVQITTPWLWLAAADPLRMDIDTLGAAVAVPAAALDVPTPQKLEIDLAADLTLQPAAVAIAANGKLTFVGKLRGLHALGGYSPRNNRTFIALTGRKLAANETDTQTARRIKLVFCHELGHALGLAWSNARNHTHARDDHNDRLYSDAYGGTGPHCKHNAHLQPSGADHGRDSTTSGEIYVHAGGGPLCIMYHALALAHMGDDFCEQCKAHLRRAAVRL